MCAQQARAILRRIHSVKNTQKITRAMKMVAAAKLTRAQQRMEGMRPYAEGILRTLRVLSVDLVGDEHPLFRPREPRRALSIVIAGDRGLCGGFNAAVLRQTRLHLRGLPDIQHAFFAVGKRANAGLKKLGPPILKTYFDVFDKLSYVLAGEVCEQVLELHLSEQVDKRVDEVYLVYNRFVSMLRQEPTVVKILPIDYKKLEEERRAELERENGEVIRPIYEIEPDIESVIHRLVSYVLATEVYRAVVESYAAELAARMTAMDNATNNAGDMIDSLTLDYNRARQTGITAELLDIVGGANAMQ